MARKTKKTTKTKSRLAAIAGGKRKPRASTAPIAVIEPKPVRILAISAFPGHLQGTSTCYGLGDDGRLYCWDGKLGTWLPNWNVAVASESHDGTAADKAAA